ncbi:hypothetical protein HMPREF1987_01585 [Peptostreptococcaceae bacterium oral taxon 113 str. W5053]|nr:hypothetical protein HMPREF1987_01585 [Peptostreptococcaceae bacterium oral taxon 113 str. W5053]
MVVHKNYFRYFTCLLDRGHIRNYRFFLCQFLKEGGEAMNFDYFYNGEAERFNFLKVPEILVDGEEFKGLSAEAIILYSMLLR